MRLSCSKEIFCRLCCSFRCAVCKVKLMEKLLCGYTVHWPKKIKPTISRTHSLQDIICWFAAIISILS